MNSTATDTAPAPRSAAPPGATLGRGEVLLTLVRREFWEHRALWLAPLVVAALLALSVTIGRLHIELDDAERLGSGLQQQQQVAVSTIIQLVLAVPLYIVVIFVGSFYLLDCLYAERKDRSILFWKSLPVSDELVADTLLKLEQQFGACRPRTQLQTSAHWPDWQWIDNICQEG